MHLLFKFSVIMTTCCHSKYALFLYINIVYLFCETEGLPRNNILSYLTRNRTQTWLKNMTENVSSFNSYCSVCCMNLSKNMTGKTCGRHTMCLYGEDKAGPSCKGFLNIRFSEDEIAAIVDAHNTIRNKVAMGWESKGDPGPQPRASNMRTVEWDEELALLASRWAAQCVFAHDLCRDLARYPVGQNIAKGNFAMNNELSFIIGWYENVDTFSNAEVSNYQTKAPTDPVSQYTQLVWAETYQIGCARVAFQQSKGPNVTYREHFICNYGPTGNIPGQPVYKIGAPCSSCSDGTGCTVEYAGLCGSETVFEINYEKQNRRTSKKEPNDANLDSLSNALSFVIFFHYIILKYTY